jgi:hypothetical protein
MEFRLAFVWGFAWRFVPLGVSSVLGVSVVFWRSQTFQFHLVVSQGCYLGFLSSVV